MKVLLTTDTYYPMINGVVISTSNLYKELKNQGHDVKILTLSHSGGESIEGDIYYLESIAIGIYPDARIKMPFHNRLIKEILDWHPDIVHSQTEFSTMLVAKHIVKKLNIPQIHTYHTMYEDYLNYLLGGKILRKSATAKITKILLNSMDGVIAPSDKTKKALRTYGIESDINIIPTGIEINSFQRSVKKEEEEKLLLELSLEKKHKLIVYVGRVAEEKNIEEIIELFPQILEKVQNAKLLIVGGGPHLEVLRKIVKERELENSIIFTGMVAPEEVFKYYKIAQLFVTASTSETQGLTYVEALSSGCPIVCKYDKAVEEVVIQGKTGFYYKNSWEFILYTSEILLNEELRRELSIKAEKKAVEYSSEAFGSKVQRFYYKVVNSSSIVNSAARASRIQY